MNGKAEGPKPGLAFAFKPFLPLPDVSNVTITRDVVSPELLEAPIDSAVAASKSTNALPTILPMPSQGGLPMPQSLPSRLASTDEATGPRRSAGESRPLLPRFTSSTTQTQVVDDVLRRRIENSSAVGQPLVPLPRAPVATLFPLEIQRFTLPSTPAKVLRLPTHKPPEEVAFSGSVAVETSILL